VALDDLFEVATEVPVESDGASVSLGQGNGFGEQTAGTRGVFGPEYRRWAGRAFDDNFRAASIQFMCIKRKVDVPGDIHS